MLTDAQRLRYLLVKTGLSQRAAARELEINKGSMRCYCSGDQPVPRVVILALERLIEKQREARHGQP